MIIRRLLSDIRGTTAVEFAITAPLFFGLLFSVVEGGRLMWMQIGMQHVVEMTARCASLQTIQNPTPCQGGTNALQFATQQATKLALPVPSSTFTFDVESCGMKVSANYRFVFVAGYFGSPSLTLSAQSCFPRLVDPEDDVNTSDAGDLVHFG